MFSAQALMVLQRGELPLALGGPVPGLELIVRGGLLTALPQAELQRVLGCLVS